MRERLALAGWLAAIVASGCSAIPERSVALVADHSTAAARPSWSWLPRKRPPAAAPRPISSAAKKPRVASPEAGRDDQIQTFLDGLDADTRELVEEELSDVKSDAERTRLLTYLATLPIDRAQMMLIARHRERLLTKRGAAPAQTVARAATVVPAGPNAASESTHEPRPVEPAAAQSASDFFWPPKEAQNSASETAAAAPKTGRVVEADALHEPLSADATTGEHADPNASPLSRLRQWDPRRALSFGRSGDSDPSVSDSAEPPAAADTLLSPLAKITGRRLRPETSAAPTADAEPLPVATHRSDLESSYLDEELHRLISLMEAKTGRLEPGNTFAEREVFVRRHALLRMLYLMGDEPQRAQQAIPGVDSSTQEFWTSLMWGLSSYFDSEATPDPADRAALALQQLHTASLHLQGIARLDVRNVAFCDKIDGFGVYHPFERNVFRAGQPVLIYAEVANFKTEPSPTGQYLSRLKSTIEILRNGPDGELVERKVFDTTEDLSRSPRTDYFHSYKLDLPTHLTPGPHTARLTLDDELSGKIASTTIDFLVR